MSISKEQQPANNQSVWLLGSTTPYEHRYGGEHTRHPLCLTFGPMTRITVLLVQRQHRLHDASGILLCSNQRRLSRNIVIVQHSVTYRRLNPTMASRDAKSRRCLFLFRTPIRHEIKAMSTSSRCIRHPLGLVPNLVAETRVQENPP